MSEPKRITAGNSYSWNKTLPDYPPGDGWTLAYTLVNQSQAYTVSATQDGDAFAVNLAASVTGTWEPGGFQLVGYVTNGDERKTIYSERLIVEPDFTSAADLRSYAAKTLEAIEALIAGAATKDQAAITVDGQSLTRRSFTDLLVLRSRFKREVATEEMAAKAKRAGRLPGRVQVRFK